MTLESAYDCTMCLDLTETATYIELSHGPSTQIVIEASTFIPDIMEE